MADEVPKKKRYEVRLGEQVEYVESVFHCVEGEQYLFKDADGKVTNRFPIEGTSITEMEG
jgi:hypothetical protein